MILDADATVDKAAGLLAEASQDGVELAVFPEAFVSIEGCIYPVPASELGFWD